MYAYNVREDPPSRDRRGPVRQDVSFAFALRVSATLKYFRKNERRVPQRTPRPRTKDKRIAMLLRNQLYARVDFADLREVQYRKYCHVRRNEFLYFIDSRCGILLLLKTSWSARDKPALFFPASSGSPKPTETKQRKTADTQILRYTGKTCRGGG